MTLLEFWGLVAGIGLVCALWYGVRRLRHRRLFRRPLPPDWIELLERRVPLYRRLPLSLRPALHGHIQWFLADKEFVGCNGQEITDEVRLTVAGNACLLVLHRRDGTFPGFRTILVYPDTYVSRQVSYDGMVEIHGHSARLGESWHRGPVVLSWSDVVYGSDNPEDGHNVVLHEFAHKLDEENAVMDGLPVLRDRHQYVEWAQVMNREFDAFIERVKHHQNRVIDAYGAISPPEFFAVVTETFFEKPEQMRRRLPDLYRQLSALYGVDPASW